MRKPIEEYVFYLGLALMGFGFMMCILGITIKGLK